ncbi:MAG: AAC(3) family N-acetyltransferase [Candidatus Latescibacteria bacterium]|nr:AAC(3) family N-acetyltransferase [Candidatus Latescibacterota bacterium]
MDDLAEQIRNSGINGGDTVLVHSSFKSLGIRDPEEFILAMLEVLGEYGTLLMPSLSYKQHPPHIHSTNTTPSCVGFLSEYFRTRAGTVRSQHPTHSVCGVGYKMHELLGTHGYDSTPCGHHSPFNKLFHRGGKILMVGCGLKPNTSMHAIEEYVQPPYLFGAPTEYTITDAQGHTFTRTYLAHGFRGFAQRYDRVQDILGDEGLGRGVIGQAQVHVLDCGILFEQALAALRRDPLFFVDPIPDGPRGRHQAK